MLKDFIEQKHYKFADSASSWQDAIRMSCESLEADGTVEENYKEDIIRCIEKYGPYILIMENVAMPHCQENARGVHKTAIGFMRLAQPGSFDATDPEKKAQLFFILASCNPDQHLDNMSRLAELLSNEDLVTELAGAENVNDLRKLQEKYGM